MKSFEEYLNESKTTGKNIQNYGKSWTTEWTQQYFKQMLGFFINGVEEGLKENEKYYKATDIESQLKLVNDIKELLKQF